MFIVSGGQASRLRFAIARKATPSQANGKPIALEMHDSAEAAWKAERCAWMKHRCG
jgi:hypothetical protein